MCVSDRSSRQLSSLTWMSCGLVPLCLAQPAAALIGRFVHSPVARAAPPRGVISPLHPTDIYHGTNYMTELARPPRLIYYTTFWI